MLRHRRKKGRQPDVRRAPGPVPNGQAQAPEHGDCLGEEMELDVGVVGVAVAEVTGLDVTANVGVDTGTADDREREL